LAALILHGIMEQRRDSLVFISAIFEHERRDAHQVRDVRDLRAFANLPCMQLAGQDDRAIEPWPKGRRGIQWAGGVAHPAVIVQGSG
jgi:hypothetical protein